MNTSSPLTYTALVCEHFRLNIDYQHTLRIVETLFPDNRNDAIALWQSLQTQQAYATYSQ